MRRNWVLLLAVVLLFTACGSSEKTVVEKQQADVQATVVWYNALLADCFRDLNMSAMAQVATAERAQQVYYYMASLGEAGLRMDARLTKIDFGALRETAGDRVEIPAAEIWDYVYFDIKSGKKLFANTVEYDLAYSLVNQADKWLVAGITVKATRESKDSTFIFQRPAGSRPGEATAGGAGDGKP